ncbi:MAG: hypothetical protein AAB903_00685, partial [Patescibacteria group bacterium]
GGNHYLSQAFSQLAGAAGNWSTSTTAFDVGNTPGKNIHTAPIDEWTYLTSYTIGGGALNLKSYKIVFNSPLFN